MLHLSFFLLKCQGGRCSPGHSKSKGINFDRMLTGSHRVTTCGTDASHSSPLSFSLLHHKEELRKKWSITESSRPSAQVRWACRSTSYYFYYISGIIITLLTPTLWGLVVKVLIFQMKKWKSGSLSVLPKVTQSRKRQNGYKPRTIWPLLPILYYSNLW